MLRHAETERELALLQDLYEKSFPKSEKKPFAFMLQKRQEGFFDLLMMEDPECNFCGLAIMLLSGELALLDYLAVEPRCQGSGLGSRALAELQERYGRDRIVVEIESTEEKGDVENRRERARRKEFYLRNGMSAVGFLVDLMGVEMEILTYGRPLTFPEYYEIYDNVLPENLKHKIKQILQR